jgi:hypothetical protein
MFVCDRKKNREMKGIEQTHITYSIECSSTYIVNTWGGREVYWAELSLSSEPFFSAFWLFLFFFLSVFLSFFLPSVEEWLQSAADLNNREESVESFFW